MWKPSAKDRKKPRSSFVSEERGNVGKMQGLFFFLFGVLGVFFWLGFLVLSAAEG